MSLFWGAPAPAPVAVPDENTGTSSSFERRGSVNSSAGFDSFSFDGSTFHGYESLEPRQPSPPGGLAPAVRPSIARARLPTSIGGWPTGHDEDRRLDLFTMRLAIAVYKLQNYKITSALLVL